MANNGVDRDHVLFVIVFYFVLSLGCFWQIFNVCKMYFNYPTNIFIETNFDPASKPLPALTFCSNIGEPTNSGINSSEALEVQSRRFNDMFSMIEISGNLIKSYSLKEDYLDKAIERVSLNFYCITLNSLITSNKVTELKYNEKFKVRIQKYGRYGWWLFLHNSFDLPPSTSWNGIELKAGQSYKVTWKVNAFRLLESPYPSDCKKYRFSTPYISRADCIRNCKLNVSTTKCEAIYWGIDFQRGDSSYPFSGEEHKECEIDKIDFDTICRKSCPHFDCDIDYYEPIAHFQTKCDGGCLWLEMTIPTKPETAYYHEPRIETVEFICYLASTIGMWFGVSIYSLYYLFTICRNKIVNKDKNMADISKVPHTHLYKRGVSNKSFPGTRRMGWYSGTKQNLKY